MTLKMAVLAPMPSARVTRTARLKAGDRASALKARRRSWATSCIRIRSLLQGTERATRVPGELGPACGERAVRAGRRPETGLAVPHPASPCDETPRPSAPDL